MYRPFLNQIIHTLDSEQHTQKTVFASFLQIGEEEKPFQAKESIY